MLLGCPQKLLENSYLDHFMIKKFYKSHYEPAFYKNICLKTCKSCGQCKPATNEYFCNIRKNGVLQLMDICIECTDDPAKLKTYYGLEAMLQADIKKFITISKKLDDQLKEKIRNKEILIQNYINAIDSNAKYKIHDIIKILKIRRSSLMNYVKKAHVDIFYEKGVLYLYGHSLKKVFFVNFNIKQNIEKDF